MKHIIGKHGAVILETKNGGVCAECGKEVKRRLKKRKKNVIKSVEK